MQTEYLDRGHFKYFDVTLMGLTAAMCVIGVVTIYSANLQSDSLFYQGLYLRQVYWLCLAALIMIAVMMVDYHFIERMAYPLYFVSVGALLAVTLFGRAAGGSQRWLEVGGFNLQPSEFMKIALIILLARLFDEIQSRGAPGIRELLKPAIFVGAPFLIVAKQPDLGTAIIFLVIFGVMAFINGIQRTLLIRGAALVALAAPLLWLALKPYQKRRILTIINPEADPMGHGYQIIQSKIAIGSGGLWGKGIFEGTQSKLNFLPAKHTDFIFSVFAEEAGFIGALILLVIFIAFMLRILDAMKVAKDKFGALIVAGVAGMLGFNFLYNIAMTVGLAPVVGIPLPFISYGGSALLTNFVALGLVFNVSLGRFRVD